MGKPRLFGYGNLRGYGSYRLVVANDIKEATELIKKDVFKDFKEKIAWYKETAHIRNGKALNGCGDMFLYCNKNGYYDMDDDSLFEAFSKNEFGKDLFLIESEKKPFKVTDLHTNIWRGETA